VGEDQPLPLIEQFVGGYCQHGKLTDAEIEAVPDLVGWW
jgi:homoserine kinase type II